MRRCVRSVCACHTHRWMRGRFVGWEGGGVQGELRGSENNGSVCSGDVGGFSLSAIKARRR